MLIHEGHCTVEIFSAKGNMQFQTNFTKREIEALIAFVQTLNADGEHKVLAVKHVRRMLECGLKEAMRFVEDC